VRSALVALAVASLARAGPALAKEALAPGERIDLNRASVSELMRLPAVGEKRARAIVEHRTRRPFRRIEDVLAVKGLGRAWLAKVRAHVTVGAAAPPRAAVARGPPLPALPASASARPRPSGP
jgi:competence protein ComEA